jgi:hypothetical protein
MFGCNNNYVKSIYPVPSKKLFKKLFYYQNKYGYIGTLRDTIIIEKKLCRIYSGGILKEIGGLNTQNRMGYWFIFKDSLNTEYILNYDTDKSDSFYHPFAIVQQKW